MFWYQQYEIQSQKYRCGYCDSEVAGDRGYRTEDRRDFIAICPGCDRPTYLAYLGDGRVSQSPAPGFGRSVAHLPGVVQRLYDEARQCAKVSSYTAAVMVCRKLLMHVAVENGAAEDKSFKYYVNWLEEKHYIPPNGKDIVEYIREKGNEANHEIVPMEKEDAEALIGFLELFMRFIYEVPKLSPTTPSPSG